MTAQVDRGIPEARVDDLDLDDPADAAKWQQRLTDMSRRRLEVARERLERMGVIDETGALVSDEEPPEMNPALGTSIETG
jgi:hypothetical protein